MITEPMTRDLQVGDIAYFDFLHLDKARRDQHAVGGQDALIPYRVMAKGRPMLVIGKTDGGSAVRWYTVLKLTSKGTRPDGRIKPGHVIVGNILGDGVTSYIQQAPHCYPENLRSFSKLRKRLNLAEVQGILDTVTAERGGMTPPASIPPGHTVARSSIREKCRGDKPG